MKIRAIRLREVGIFREPVAIEGFSGQLDVLAGPNELGKSTVLAALKKVFLFKPSSKHAQIEQLRPHGGGAPLIETDFEAQGRVWRLRKQFLTGRGHAELTDLLSDRVVERGPDAHLRALELIGLREDEPGSLGLLWVGQTEGLRPAPLAAGERDLLMAVIEGEVASVATGTALRAIEAEVETELGALLTARTGKPRAVYDKALKDVDRLSAELRAAQEQSRQVEDRRSELERLRQAQARLQDPAQQALLAGQLTSARKAVEDGRRAREQHKLAQVARQAHESRRAQIELEARTLRDKLAELSRLQVGVQDLGAQLKAAEEIDAGQRLAAEAAVSERSVAEKDLSEARELLNRRERIDALALLRQRLGEAGAAVAEAERVQAAIDAIAVTDLLIRKAQTEFNSVERLQASLDAAAPHVAVAYLPGIENAISVEGRPLAGGAVLRPAEPLVLQIAGIGSITVTPVAAIDLADLSADLEAHRAELDATLAAMGVADLEAARVALALRRRHEIQVAGLSERIKALAPDGMAALERRVASADAGADGEDTSDVPSRADILDRITVLEAGVAQSAREAVQRERAAAQSTQAVVRLKATCEAARGRQDAIAAELRGWDDPGAHLDSLDIKLAEATAAANDSWRSVQAWAEAAPTDVVWAELQAALQRHEQARDRTMEELATLRQAIARIEGDLERGGESDIGQRIDELQGELNSARAEVDRCKRDADALSLLARLIEDSKAQAQDRYLAPVVDRIQPYLRVVLPEARVRMNVDLTPYGLQRGEAGAEAVATLSGGTQEQLAILTRLAFGRLLADRGQSTPVILDDALVYSDDDRIERMLGVLREAAQHHQVIVLTCRSRVFEPLGGTPLRIEPWTIT